MALSSGAVYVAGLRSAVEAVARAKRLPRPHVEHRINSGGELVVAVLVPAGCDEAILDEVRAGLEVLAAKTDGARIATKTSRRAGKVLALVVPPIIAGQWTSLDPSWRPTPPPEWHRSAQCDLCSKSIAAPDYLAMHLAGWERKTPGFEPGSYGWVCPVCRSYGR